MMVVRYAGAAALGLAMAAGATPASAQFFLKSHDFAGAPVTGDEPGMVLPMPGATAAEQRAGLTWTLRSALNVAALQCQFEPTLATVESYNAILKDHQVELKAAFATLGKYYARTNKNKKTADGLLDAFGTRTYSAFATVSAQYGFCQTASAIGREALFTPRGQFGALAERRMRTLRNSLVPYGEEQFDPRLTREAMTPLPRLDAQCWSKAGEWQTKKCGAPTWPAGGPGIAAR